MPNIRTRIEKLEATAPRGSAEQITAVERVMVGQFNPDGTPKIIVRQIKG
jgi:hypothetical protein